MEKEYFDEIYQMKQIAARRKLAYDNNQVGRVKRQRTSAASSKDWTKAKSIGKNRNRLAQSMTSKGEDQPRLTNL